MKLDMPSIVIAGIIGAIAGFAAGRAASGPRYQLAPGGLAYRLDTHTGHIDACMARDTSSSPEPSHRRQIQIVCDGQEP